MTKKIFGADELFNKWLGSLVDSPDMRYLGAERQGFVEHLILTFHASGIDQDEASTYKRRVVDALTTPEGRKGKGRHKGWKETVEESFVATLANIYIADLTDKQIKDAKGNMIVNKRSGKDPVSVENTSAFTISEDNRIVEWVRNKYGGNLDITNEAHRIGSLMNIEFLQDNYFQNVVY